MREGIHYALTQVRRFHRGPDDEPVVLAVDAPDIVAPGQPWSVTVSSRDDRLAVRTEVVAESSDSLEQSATLSNQGGGRYAHTFAGLSPGLHTVRTCARGQADSVTAHILAWDDADD